MHEDLVLRSANFKFSLPPPKRFSCFDHLVPWHAGINECKIGADNCAADSTCTDMLGNFECTCNPGFSGDGIVACMSEFYEIYCMQNVKF